jgi:hypothetical protein
VFLCKSACDVTERTLFMLSIRYGSEGIWIKFLRGRSVLWIADTCFLQCREVFVDISCVFAETVAYKIWCREGCDGGKQKLRSKKDYKHPLEL